MKKLTGVFLLILFISCKGKNQSQPPVKTNSISKEFVKYAKGFTIEKSSSGITIIRINSPWPNAKKGFTYALIPKDSAANIPINHEAYDAVVATPVKRIVVTSTTHIPALEALHSLEKLVGFPDTQYVSSKKARARITSGKIKELGNNESMNTEMVIELNPEVVIGFGIDSQNKAYETIQRSNIPVVYNGDWTEETPLGKAEWIKFFAPFFEKEIEAQEIFTTIEHSYEEAVRLAKSAKTTPTVLGGALYKDVWYSPGGKSWAARFLKDANANYLWANTTDTGSLSLSWENVLDTARNADFWIGPAQFTSYEAMTASSQHYEQFEAFSKKKVFTFAKTKGATGGLLYYELAPHRPDFVLKDLVHILHPEILPDHELFFFKPLD